MPAHSSSSLVSIGLPVRNAARTLEGVVQSVLAQDYEHIELVITDNASTDDTEALCRRLAAANSRIVYHRQPENVGILNNFTHALRLARGTYFRWIGDDDWIDPTYVSRCLRVFSSDSRLILVTTQIGYVRSDGSRYTRAASDTALSSDDPVRRFQEIISYLIYGMPIDPLYGLARRSSLMDIARRNMVGEDEVFAAKLALMGPWGHEPEVLAQRSIGSGRLTAIARRLGVPVWQAHMSTTLQCYELLRWLRTRDLTARQRRQVRLAVGRLFVLRQYDAVARRMRRVANALLALGSKDG